MAPSGKPTMQDVARAANVSTATVSRVLRGEEGVSSPETTARVLKCAAELGYIVNAVASSMRSRQTRTVGLMVADVSNPWFGQLARGVESVLGPQGFSVVVANTDNDVGREPAAVETLLRQQVDALVVASHAADGSHLQGALARGTVVVLVDAELPDLPVDTITIDNEAAAYTAVEHLLAYGHEDVAIVHGGTDATFDQGRIAGYQNALAARGLPVRPGLITAGRSTFEGGRAAVTRLLELPLRPSAIFSTNNLMTVGALMAIADAGLTAPDDISIVAIDDMEWFPIAQPAITAVYEPAQVMGRKAAERVLLRLRRKNEPRVEHIRLDTEFRVRRSAGPPASVARRTRAGGDA